MKMFRPRYYSYKDAAENAPCGKFQIDRSLQNSWRGDKPKLPESLLRLAHEEYKKQNPGQSYERMQERGGLSLLEIVRLLGDNIERSRD